MTDPQTPCLRARRPRLDDAPALASICRTPEAARWLNGGEVPTTDDMAAMADRKLMYWRENGFGRWYWIEQATAELIARCGPGLVVVPGAQELGNAASQAVARRAGFARERQFEYDGQSCVLFRRYNPASASRKASSSASSIE